jgi:hypothetical protein
MASSREALACCAQSLSLARISVFGGGSAEKSPPDKGHFVVQPTGSFQQPLRRCGRMHQHLAGTALLHDRARNLATCATAYSQARQ